jgi:hypothetical protein
MLAHVLFWSALGLWFLYQRWEEQGNSLVNTTPTDKIKLIAQAIAHAENGSSRVNARNNPGNIREVAGGPITTYDSLDIGWQKLYNKLDFDFVSGRSHIYSARMTWREVAWMWVNGGPVGTAGAPQDNPDNWASVVASDLGVDVTSTVAAYLSDGVVS